MERYYPYPFGDRARGYPKGWPLLFLGFSVAKVTFVYVDVFNLYYGCLRKTSFRWLDISLLCSKLLTDAHIVKIKYFTARVSDRPSDPTQSSRQQIYLRALATIPNLEIIYGHYLSHEVFMPIAGSTSSPPKKVKVIKTEEKGSDVNLASHLLLDGFKKEYQVAAVISNDSDLVTPIRMAKGEFRLTVGVLNPQDHPSRELVKTASFFKSIRSENVLHECQFPDVMKDKVGEFRKPAGW